MASWLHRSHKLSGIRVASRTCESSPARPRWGRLATARHEYVSAAAVLAVITCVWFWPLLKGDQLGQSYVLGALPPWAASRPAKLPARDAFPDAAVGFHPWAVVARDELRKGELPLWNPYEYGGGMTLVGNMQSALLFPLTWLLYFLPIGYAAGAVAAAKVLLAGLGAYALSRELRVDRGGALVAGTVYMLSAPLMTALQYPFGSVFALFPWLLFTTERLLQRRTAGAVAGVGLAFALTLLAGHPESALISLSAAGVFVTGRLAFDRAGWRDIASRIRTAGCWGAGLLLGAAISAVVLIPFLQALGTSITRRGHESALSPFQLPLSTVLQYPMPGLFGDGEPHVYGVPLYVTVAGYFGLPALVLALVALLRRRKDPSVTALALMAFVALMAVYRVPPVIWFLRHVPPWSDSWVDERAYFVIALAGAIGAGAGCASLMRRKLALRRVLALAACVAGAIALGFLLAEWRGGLVAPGSVKRDSIALTVLLLAASGGLLVALGRVRASVGVVLAVALAALSLAELQDLNVALPPDRAYPPKPRAIQVLQRQPRPFRVGLIRRPGSIPLPPNTAALYRLEAIEGYDYPLSRRWSDFQTRVLGFVGRHPESRSARRPPTGPALTALRMMNTRYYVAAPGTKRPVATFETAYDGPDAVVFRDPEALPRAYVVPATSELQYRQSLATVGSGRLDPRRVALVPPGSPPVPRAPKARFRAARLEILGNDHLRVHIPAGASGWLVLANAYSPTWRAEVDGHPTDLRPTDFAAMGVPVSAAARTVDFRLDRTGFWLGVGISIAGLACTALLALFARLRRSRA